MTKRIIYIFILSIGIFYSNAQNKSETLVFNKTKQEVLLQEKLFSLFSAIQNDTKISAIIKTDVFFKQMLLNKKMVKNCKTDLSCLINGYLFNEKEVKSVSKHLKILFKNEPDFKRFVSEKIKASGAYENFKSMPDEDILVKSWELCANGMNRILKVYGLGEKAQYHTMDSISYDVKSDYYKTAVLMWNDMLLNKKKDNQTLFFDPALNLSLGLLYLNHRDEAVRYDPLVENKKVEAHIKTIDFNKYKYSSITILGGGPENYMDRLSAAGKLNLQLGVLEYLKNNAPLIIVSGGHAHPFRSQYCEAIEMKKELVERYNIPEEAIIIDPYARHTTTNVRNASRLMIAYGVPLTKKGLIVTNNVHSKYVTSNDFQERCLRELGYQPVLSLKRVNSTTVEFLPSTKSLHLNPIDPLDP